MNKQKGEIGIIVLLAAVLIIFGLGVNIYVEQKVERLGATIPKAVALFETTLTSRISSTATSMTLTSGADKSGDDLSGYICFIIDEGAPDEEFVCGTVTGTAVASMIRGIDPIDGDEEVSALKKPHRRGSSVKVSDFPVIGVIMRVLNGDETLPNKLTYASQPSLTGDEDIATKKYADDLAIAGAPDATFTVKGIVEIATTAESIIGTATGSTAATLVVPTSLFNETFSATNIVPVTGTDGKLGQGFIDLTEAFTWTGAHTFSATSTMDFVDIGNGLTVSSGNLAISSGTLSVGSTTLFTGAPSYASDPASANVLTRKSYVDANDYMKSYTTTLADVVNTTTKTAFVTATIPANAIADGDVIEMTVVAGFKSPSGGSWNLTSTFRLEYDTDIVLLANPTWVGGGTERFWIFKVYIIRVGTNLYVTDSLSTSIAFQDVLERDTTAGIDNTVVISNPGFSTQKDLTLTVQHGDANANCWVKPKTAKIIKITD